MESKVFDVEAAGLTFPFKFYTFDSIQDDLKKFFWRSSQAIRYVNL